MPDARILLAQHLRQMRVALQDHALDLLSSKMANIFPMTL